MYYRRVNRGLSFTKPGLYSFGLVLLIGMIAVTTGINGLYVFLSAGLGGFIISGLLSERAMRSCNVTSVSAAMADADAPFTLTFTVENVSSWFTVFALQTFFMLKAPKFRLISAPPAALAAVKLGRVPPAAQLIFTAPCEGMPRGRHLKILAMQQTSFPFGILEKYKLHEVAASLTVAPRVDPAFLDELRHAVLRRLAAQDAEKEFFSHRAYVARDAIKDVDWKKSAARPTSDWVVKQYRAPAAAAPLCLDAAWDAALGLADERGYEAYLAQVRTALKVFEESQRRYYLDLGQGLCLSGYDVCLAALAGAPAFADRRRGVEAVANTRAADLAAGGARLTLRPGGYEWVEARRGRTRA